MDHLFTAVLLGHLTGDYLLQTKRQALNKSRPGWPNLFLCWQHCLIYTLTIGVFTQNFSPAFLSLVFLSHFPLDRWSLAEKWLRLIKGRTFAAAMKTPEPARQFDIAFTCLVYAVADNTLHLLGLWLIVHLL